MLEEQIEDPCGESRRREREEVKVENGGTEYAGLWGEVGLYPKSRGGPE